MRFYPWLLWIVLFVGESSASEVVRMEPFYVDGARIDLQLQYSHDVVTKIITGIRVVEVGPRMQKSGIKAGDQVVSLDGRAVAGMTIEEFVAALPKSAGPAEQKRVFVISRGVFGKRIEIPIVFRQRKSPSQTAEPTAAGARSRK